MHYYAVPSMQDDYFSYKQANLQIANILSDLQFLEGYRDTPSYVSRIQTVVVTVKILHL